MISGATAVELQELAVTLRGQGTMTELLAATLPEDDGQALKAIGVSSFVLAYVTQAVAQDDGSMLVASLRFWLANNQRLLARVAAEGEL